MLIKSLWVLSSIFFLMVFILSFLWFGIFKFCINSITHDNRRFNPTDTYFLSLISYIIFVGSYYVLIVDGLLYRGIPFLPALLTLLSYTCVGVFYGKVITNIENQPIKSTKGLKIIFMQLFLSIPVYFIFLVLLFMIVGV